MKLRVIAQYIPKEKKAPATRLTKPVQRNPRTAPPSEPLTEAPSKPVLPKEKRKRAPKKTVEAPVTPALVDKEPVAIEDKLPGTPTIEDVPEKAVPEKKKDIAAPVKDLPEIRIPEVDIDISSPAQAALSMSTIVDNILAGAADVLKKIQQMPEADFKTNPTKTRQQVEKLVNSLNSQVVQLREVSDAFGSQVQAV
jgi:hypothetical protein